MLNYVIRGRGIDFKLIKALVTYIRTPFEVGWAFFFVELFDRELWIREGSECVWIGHVHVVHGAFFLCRVLMRMMSEKLEKKSLIWNSFVKDWSSSKCLTSGLARMLINASPTPSLWSSHLNSHLVIPTTHAARAFKTEVMNLCFTSGDPSRA